MTTFLGFTFQSVNRFWLSFVCPTVVPVPEVVCVSDGVDGEVVDDTTGGHKRISLRVNVGVTFPRLSRAELCTDTNKEMIY